MRFEIVSDIDSIEVIAVGRSLRELQRLRKQYGSGRWRKMKGFATVRYMPVGPVRREEVHWYEAHGIGKREFKIKYR